MGDYKMRNIRKLDSQLNDFKEFIEQSNDAFEQLAKSIEDLEKVVSELIERVEKLEHTPKKSKKYEEE